MQVCAQRSWKLTKSLGALTLAVAAMSCAGGSDDGASQGGDVFAEYCARERACSEVAGFAWTYGSVEECSASFEDYYATYSVHPAECRSAEQAFFRCSLDHPICMVDIDYTYLEAADGFCEAEAAASDAACEEKMITGRDIQDYECILPHAIEGGMSPCRCYEAPVSPEDASLSVGESCAGTIEFACCFINPGDEQPGCTCIPATEPGAGAVCAAADVVPSCPPGEAPGD